MNHKIAFEYYYLENFQNHYWWIINTQIYSMKYHALLSVKNTIE